MKLPRAKESFSQWPEVVADEWDRLVTRARKLKTDAGRTDRFARMVETFRKVAHQVSFHDQREIFRERVAARAMTWLWLHDEGVGRKLMSVKVLDTLVDVQQPRLTRVTTLQLLQLYFREFDQLDGLNEPRSAGLREALECHLVAQLARLPEPKPGSHQADALSLLRNDGDRLFGIDGPRGLADRVRKANRELGDAFSALGLAGLDTGRYGNVCRAHFYLETLRGLAPDQWHPVLDELLKPAVSRVPFEGGKRIGHAALEILIDKAGDSPGERWQDFVLSLAGDPRIASSSPNFVEWWRPLGEARIERVRNWLSKEDLRLFLQAVEEYGKEARNDDLQRMFPERKTFLEGLYNLGMIRTTRLMLGKDAEASVKRILRKEVKTSFAQLKGSMADKAVIYLDCGDIHFVEGSHNFQIWVYLARPSPEIVSYDKNYFSHSDLTKTLPQHYKSTHPGHDCKSFFHQPGWQNKVFDFLAKNGIRLDIEELLSEQDYRHYLEHNGVPVVRSENKKATRMTEVNTKPKPKPKLDSAAAASDAPFAKRIDALSDMDILILRYLSDHPGEKAQKTANGLNIKRTVLNSRLHGPLKEFCAQDANYGWSLKPKVRILLDRVWPDK